MTTFENYVNETHVSETYADIVEQLIQRRNDLGYTQEALADMIGCTTSLVHKWEQYKRVPSGFMLSCWLDALGVEIKIVTKNSESNDISM